VRDMDDAVLISKKKELEDQKAVLEEKADMMNKQIQELQGAMTNLNVEYLKVLGKIEAIDELINEDGEKDGPGKAE